MNVYVGQTVRHNVTEREYKVADVSRHFLTPTLYVVFTRNIGGTRESNCASLEYFEKNFTPVETSFFRRVD